LHKMSDKKAFFEQQIASQKPVCELSSWYLINSTFDSRSIEETDKEDVEAHRKQRGGSHRSRRKIQGEARFGASSSPQKSGRPAVTTVLLKAMFAVNWDRIFYFFWSQTNPTS